MQPITTFFVHRVEDFIGGVETDQIKECERAHRQAAAKTHRGIDVLAGGVFLLIHGYGMI